MLNILYDATIIGNAFKKDANRSGIFVTAKNLLDELIKRDDVKISLYVGPERASK